MRTNDEIIAFLQTSIEEKGISMSELARKVGIAKSTMSRYFNKTREFPLNRADEFAKVLNVTTEFFLGLGDENKFSGSRTGLQSENRLQEAMNRKGLNRYELFMKTIPYQNNLGIEIKENDLLEYIAGTRPSDEKIYLLARSLNVSEGWLLGYDVNMDRVPDSERGSLDFLDILIIYNQLDTAGKQKVVAFARDELSKQKRQ